MHRFISKTLLILACTFGASLHAQVHRHHGTHEHGVSALNLAQEGREIHIELDSPAANIIGFEHAPSTAADREALSRATATLRNGDHLFRFSEEAGCRLAAVKVDTALMQDDDPLHAHREHHAHEEEHEDHGETHADITAEYHFNCVHPQRLKQVHVKLFQAFPATRRLQVQFITESAQGAADLSESNAVLEF